MLEDAILKEATAEVEHFLLSIVPEEAGEPHVFSAGFERKMQKLTRRANHPVRYRLIRVACFDTKVAVKFSCGIFPVFILISEKKQSYFIPKRP